MLESCKVMVGSRPYFEPCGDRARYHVEVQDTEYDRPRMIPACSEHAAEAIDGERLVTGPTGNECRLDDEGELYEVSE